VTVREVWPATKGEGGGRNDICDAGERYPVAMDIITAQVSTPVFLSRRSRGSEGPAVPGASKDAAKGRQTFQLAGMQVGCQQGRRRFPDG
jgi:hypothetical protein